MGGLDGSRKMSEISEILGENSEAVFRALMECSPDFVCLATTHGEPFYLNATARRWIGLEEDAPLSSVSLARFLRDESWRELRDVAVPAVNKTGQWEGRSRLQNIKTRQQTERPHLHVPAEDAAGRAAELPGDRPSRRPSRWTACGKAWPRPRPARTRSSNRRWTRSSRSTTRA